MKNKTILLLLLIPALFSLSAQSLFGQVKKREEKQLSAINALKSTAFFTKYKAIKEQIESSVTQFNSDRKMKNLSPESVEEVAVAYEHSVEMFDQALDKLKNAITGPDKEKAFLKDPEQFTKTLMPKIERAYTNYKNGCQLKIDRLSGSGRGGDFNLDEVNSLVALSEAFSKVIEENQSKMAKMSTDFFEKNFINDLRLKRWEEY